MLIKKTLNKEEINELRTPFITDRLLLYLSILILLYFHNLLPNVIIIILLFLLSTLYSIIFSWTQHTMLDNKRSLMHIIPLIRVHAISFQHHHDNPTNVLYETENAPKLPGNIPFTGVKPIVVILTPLMISALIVFFIEKNKFTMQILIFSQMLYFWAYISIRNHVSCHAETHHYPTDRVCYLMRNIGLLPSPLYHRIHHDPNHKTPHEQNWAFIMPYISEKIEYIFKQTGGSESNYAYIILNILFFIFLPTLFPLYSIIIRQFYK
tara:strand:+ start:3406 stop:4203 length:798 start_codon:yes stop_codon:yes gene_type:complete